MISLKNVKTILTDSFEGNTHENYRQNLPSPFDHFLRFPTRFSVIKEGSIITLTPAIIAAAAKCNYSLVGSWISTNRNPSEYETFLSFTESGDISEIGAFNVAHPPGSYKLKPDCSIIATITEANNNILSLTGEIVSNNSMYLTVDNQGDDIELVKVSDTGACQGTWNGTLNHIILPAPPSSTIQFQVNSDGAITSFIGLAATVSGKMYCESGKGVAHLKTGEANGFREMVLDGTLTGKNMTGVYGIDNSSTNDPDGTFSISH